MGDLAAEDAAGQGVVRQIQSASVPDVTDASYQSQLAALGDYAQTAFNEVLAQYRFMGLVCGIPGPGEDQSDVDAAREAVMEAISDFLHPEGGPLGSQIAERYREYLDMRDATDLLDRFGENEASIITDAVRGVGGIGHPTDTGGYAQDILAGVRRPNLAPQIERGLISPEGVAYVNQAADAYEEAVRLDVMRRELAAERRRQWWAGVWAGVRSYYDENMELIRNGQWLLATGRIAIDAMIFAAEEIVIAGLVAGIIAVTGGLAAAVALALRAALRMALSAVRMGTRTVRRVTATWDFKIELRKVEPGVLYSNVSPLSISVTRKLDYEKPINVETDLTNAERQAIGEGGQGSTVPDADAGEPGTAGQGGTNLDDPPAYRHPRDGDPPRSTEELVPGGRVPFSRRDPAVFQDWWDDLSYEELSRLSADEDILPQINQGIRGNGGQHEWLKVSQQLEHKRLGFSMREIQDWVTATGVAEGPLPRPTASGATRWRHNPEGGGPGSGVGSRTMHNALEGLYQPPARSRSEFLRRMGYFANSYLDGGVDGLPSGLRNGILQAGGG
ncbi:MAG: hypothetical protein AAFY65_15465 [Pseudomonadota bacterium]